MNERLLLLAAVLVGALCFFLHSLWKEKRKNALPTIRIQAEITHIRLDNRSHNGPYGRTNLIGHHVTFRTAEGELLELTAPESVGHLSIGTCGILTYQGTKCERFDVETSKNSETL